MFKRLTAEATRLPRIRTSCPPLQAAILRLKPHGSGFAELHRHFMQLEGRLQALPSYHPSHLKGWPHVDGCMLTPFYACMCAWVGRVEDSYGTRARHAHVHVQDAHAHVYVLCRRRRYCRRRGGCRGVKGAGNGQLITLQWFCAPQFLRMLCTVRSCVLSRL